MAVQLTGPHRHLVVLGSFTPRLYSGILISLLFGLNDFANSILGSRDHIHPKVCIPLSRIEGEVPLHNVH